MSLGIFFVMLFLAGCSSSYGEITSYKESEINEDFPVPAKAKVSEVEFNNSHIKGIKHFSCKSKEIHRY